MSVALASSSAVGHAPLSRGARGTGPVPASDGDRARADSDRQLHSFLLRLAGERLPAPARYLKPRLARAMLSAGRAFGLDPLLIAAVIETESSFRPDIRGLHGELGLMQLKPATGRWIAARYRLPWLGPRTLLDPEANVWLGTAYLRYMRDLYADRDGDRRRAPLFLVAYNLGGSALEGALRARGSLPRVYAERVMGHYARLRGALGRARGAGAGGGRERRA